MRLGNNFNFLDCAPLLSHVRYNLSAIVTQEKFFFHSLQSCRPDMLRLLIESENDGWLLVFSHFLLCFPLEIFRHLRLVSWTRTWGCDRERELEIIGKKKKNSSTWFRLMGGSCWLHNRMMMTLCPTLEWQQKTKEQEIYLLEILSSNRRRQQQQRKNHKFNDLSPKNGWKLLCKRQKIWDLR